MRFLPICLASGLLLAGAGAPLCAASLPTPSAEKGGISLGQTRVIFAADDKMHNLTVKNTTGRAYLLQSRVQLTPEDISPAPFIVTPPLFSIKPDSRQLLRIVSQGARLPADRESLFYLSVLAIPAESTQAAANARMSVGIRFVLKLFYRPAGLKTPPAAGCPLRFQRTPQGVQVENPTPYFQTLGQLRFNHIPIDLDAQPSMLAPMSTQTYPLKAAANQAEWQTITDYGGLASRCQRAIEPR